MFYSLWFGLFCEGEFKRAGFPLSFEKIREELSEVQVSPVRDERTGRRFLLPSRVTSTQRAIYEVFNKKLRQTKQFL